LPRLLGERNCKSKENASATINFAVKIDHKALMGEQAARAHTADRARKPAELAPV
jgi:hypothetical protein